MLKLRLEGMSMPESADKLGCSVGTVHCYVTEATSRKAPPRSPTVARLATHANHYFKILLLVSLQLPAPIYK